jgi:hypothetical protein
VSSIATDEIVRHRVSSGMQQPVTAPPVAAPRRPHPCLFEPMAASSRWGDLVLSAALLFCCACDYSTRFMGRVC